MAAALLQRKSETGLYFGTLFFFIALGSPIGGITSIAIQYILKDTFHARPFDMAIFNACAGIPLYFGFLFAILRDTVQARRIGDQGYMLLGALIPITCYLFLGIVDITYSILLTVALLIVLGLAIVSTVAQALMTIVARQRMMTGWFSAIWNIGVWAPELVAFPLGGWLAARISSAAMFFLGAAISTIIFLYRFWIPCWVLHRAPPNCDRSDEVRVGRLLTHRPLWLALAIIFLFMFSPGWQTPLFYHLTETIKISSPMYGVWLAMLAAFQIPGAILFAWASQRFSLRVLLWWGTVFMILQAPMPLLIWDTGSTVLVAVVAALMFGIGCSAYWALVMRACLSGLEGSGYMLAYAVANIASKVGDLLGSWLYEKGGIELTLAVNTVTSAMIVLVVLILPASLVAAKDTHDPSGP